MVTDWRDMREQNRRSWNAVTAAHNSHKKDQVAFFRRGGSTLFPDEIELLGDVSGACIAHLQCNCGQDTLSLARLGATVTGVDISDEAVAFATRLSADAGIDATFVRADVLEWLETTRDRFDVAFATYGFLGWLADAGRWARGVHRILAPGGRLVALEFHPLVWSLKKDGLTGDPYFLPGPIEERNGVNDYVGDALAPSGFEAGLADFENPEPAFGFQHTVADIITAIVDSGLRLDVLREYPYSNGCELFDGMRRIEGNRYTVPEGVTEVPLMLGWSATRID